MPVLVVSNDGEHSSGDSYPVVDSGIICEFLDDRFPDTPLLPKSAAQRAKARQIEQVLDRQYEVLSRGHCARTLAFDGIRQSTGARVRSSGSSARKAD